MEGESWPGLHGAWRLANEVYTSPESVKMLTMKCMYGFGSLMILFDAHKASSMSSTLMRS